MEFSNLFQELFPTRSGWNSFQNGLFDDPSPIPRATSGVPGTLGTWCLDPRPLFLRVVAQFTFR